MTLTLIFLVGKDLATMWPIWLFDLWVTACRATTIDYMCTKFGVDSSSRFTVRARTNRQTDRQTQMNALPTPAAMPAWVISFCPWSILLFCKVRCNLPKQSIVHVYWSTLLCWPNVAQFNGLASVRSSVCLSRWRVLNMTHQGAARDAASVYLSPSVIKSDNTWNWATVLCIWYFPAMWQ